MQPVSITKFAARSRSQHPYLSDGDWVAEIFRDTRDSDTNPTLYVHETRIVKAGETLSFKMAAGGGFAVRLSRLPPIE